MQRLLGWTDRVAVWLAVVSGVALLGLALFTFADVVLRYVFNRPISGSIDVIELTLVVVACLALPYAGRSEGHIVVDLVPDYPSERLTRIRDALAKLLPAAIFALLAWRAWQRADEAALFGEASNILEIPFRPFFLLVAVTAGVYALSLGLEVALLAAGRRPAPVTAGLEEGPSLRE